MGRSESQFRLRKNGFVRQAIPTHRTAVKYSNEFIPRCSMPIRDMRGKVLFDLILYNVKAEELIRYPHLAAIALVDRGFDPSQVVGSVFEVQPL